MAITVTGPLAELRELFAVSDPAVSAQLNNIVVTLSNVGVKLGAIMASEAQILDQLNASTAKSEALGAKIEKIGGESSATLAELAQVKADLAALIAAAGGTSAAVDAALQTLSDSLDRATGKATAVDGLVTDPVIVPNP